MTQARAEAAWQARRMHLALCGEGVPAALRSTEPAGWREDAEDMHAQHWSAAIC